MFIAKAFYFFYFAALSCLIPFLALYYSSLGLSGSQIGLLTGIVPLINLLGASLWSMAADALGRHRPIFLLTIIGTWVSVFLISQASTFSLLMPIVIAYAFFVGPIIPMADNAVLAWLGKNRDDYGRQRIGGSYGWGITAILIGILIQRYGLPWVFYSYLALMVIVFIVAIRLPMQVASAGGEFRIKLEHLAANKHWLFFNSVAMVVGMSLGIFLNYLFIYLETLAFGAVIMGLTLTFATISELPIFQYSRRLLTRWSPQFLLAVSLAFVLLRSLGYLTLSEPWHVLVISLLHGPTFGLMWIAGVAYAARSAPDGLGATAQGVFSGVAVGLGSAIGSLAGGLIFEAFGILNVFRFAALAAFLALILYTWVYRRSFLEQIKPKQNPIQKTQ